jgi:hypothetical protein
VPRFTDRAFAMPAQARTSRTASKRTAQPSPSPLSQILQLRAAKAARAERASAATSRDGLPGALKAGVEQLSGIAMDDVRVYRNSPEPAKLGAAAYTQRSDIHVGPGQERHLAHEAWHVVQQKQGRVRATVQAKSVPVNDEPGLEREADMMGVRAESAGLASPGPTAPHRGALSFRMSIGSAGQGGAGAVQRKILVGSKEYQPSGAVTLMKELAKNSNVSDESIETAAALWNEQDFKFHGELDVLPLLQAWTYKSRALGRQGQGGREYGRSSAFADLAEAKTMVNLSNVKIDSNTEKNRPGFLYRAMTPKEFGNLKSQKKLVPVDENAYLGLSVNPHYSAGAMTKDGLSHLVEFQFTSQTVHNALITAFEGGKIEGTAKEEGFAVSKDMSTRSIGLGPKGNASDELKKSFNDWLGNGTIQWRLLRLIK